MLSPRMQEALNAQINAEMQAFYTYLSMSAYFEAENLPGFAAWMKHHSDEELGHAMRIYRFVNERRGRVILTALSDPPTHWDSPLAAFESALKHEQHVTSLINKLVDLAVEERDHATQSFLQWFVDEQVEEELIVDNAIQDLKRIGDFAPGIVMLDREFHAQAGKGEGETEADAT
ncbi:MAG TPA: ferritin [Oceanobacillus sp.]|nr:ferritin [Oceanobacillus sp.]